MPEGTSAPPVWAGLTGVRAVSLESGDRIHLHCVSHLARGVDTTGFPEPRRSFR